MSARTISVNVRLTPEEANKLHEIAKGNRVSKSEMLRLCFVNMDQKDGVTLVERVVNLTERMTALEARINPPLTH